MFHRHPWLPYILLAVAGAAVSLIMLGIASRHTPESVPVENPGVVKP